MSEDRTTPMRKPQWSHQENDLDEQETVFADQESVTPPTIPLGDQEEQGWGQESEPGFVRTVPSEGTTPEPYGPPRQPAAPPDQTMVISERPSPIFAWLVVVDGPDRGSVGRVINLQPDTTTIGRVSGNHVSIRDDTVSSQHARIRIEEREDEESVFVLYDMGSSNGTYAGDRESYKDEENRTYRHELQDGDYLLLGETTLAFKRL
ncbi:MAG: FHA domain-containing protein [Anaerolineae bacterium]|jgi:hypothetical protein